MESKSEPLLSEAGLDDLLIEIGRRTHAFAFVGSVEPSGDDDTSYRWASSGKLEQRLGLATMLTMFHEQVISETVLPDIPSGIDEETDEETDEEING